MSHLTRRSTSSRRESLEEEKQRATTKLSHVTFNLDDNTARYHIYSQYYASCKYDIFTLGYLRAYVTRPVSRMRCNVFFVCQCHCVSHHRVTINSAAITRSVERSIDRILGTQLTRDDNSETRCPEGTRCGKVSRYLVALTREPRKTRKFGF